MTQDAIAAGPISEGRRVGGIDAARGLALLGILSVNVLLFGEPLAALMKPEAPRGEGALSLVVYYFTQVFCAGKFYPLFSLLFGVGLAMMHESAARAGRALGWTAARRLGVLALFGLAHIVLLWYGDVLFVYAICGFVMLLLVQRSARTLLIAAGCFFGVGVLLSGGAALLGAVMTPESAGGPQPMPEGRSTLHQYFNVLGDAKGLGPYDPRLESLETEIFREGPFGFTVALRLINYLFASGFLLLVMVWQVLAMFCLGAALLKLGFFRGAMPQWRRTLIWAGLAAGLPMNVAYALAYEHSESIVLAPLGMVLLQAGGPLLSLMYLSVVLELVERGRARWLTGVLAPAGRMSLTCYLLQSVLMQSVFAFWGLAQFGGLTWAQRGGLVLVVYAVCVVFACVWMSVFKYGPMEYVWRTLTYLKPVGLLRRGHETSATNPG